MGVHTAIHALDALNKRADALKLDEPLEVTLAELDIIRQMAALATDQSFVYRGRQVTLKAPGTDPA